MTMVMAAPRNGWGMVGAWPGVRVVSVRALDGGYYGRGVDRCRELAAVHNVKVILVAGGIAGAQPGSDPYADNAVNAARARGINVVAAAGNYPGPLDYPANHPAVLSVGAAGGADTACEFSAAGPELDLLAPGCGMELAHPVAGTPGTSSGTSQAAAFTASSLAALRSHRPDLDAGEAERLVRASAEPGPQAAYLSVAAAFNAAGLSRTVQQGMEAVTPRETPQASPGAPAAAGTSPPPTGRGGRSANPLPAPRVRVRYRRGRLAIGVDNRPTSCFLKVRARRHDPALEFRRWVADRRRADRVVLPVGAGIGLR